MSMTRKRTQPYIYPITPWELNAQDRQWLDKALEKDYHRTKVDAILKDAVNGYVQLWRFQDGIIVSEVTDFSGNKVLMLTQMAGKGFIKGLGKIEQAMVAYGKENSCSSFEVATAVPALQRIFSKRFKKITEVYSKEII